MQKNVSIATTYDALLSRQAAADGMQRAIDNAAAVHEGWPEKAYAFLENYLLDKPSGWWFMTEDVRRKAEMAGSVPAPPSLRAWGPIIMRASRNKLIKANGTRPVTNIKAHCANATVWVKV
jgi:hypothetical protein